MVQLDAWTAADIMSNKVENFENKLKAGVQYDRILGRKPGFRLSKTVMLSPVQNNQTGSHF